MTSSRLFCMRVWVLHNLGVMQKPLCTGMVSNIINTISQLTALGHDGCLKS